MAQAPKFIVTEDENGEWTWNLEDINANVTGRSAQSRPRPEFCVEDIINHIETAIAASGVSLSLSVDWQPIIEERPYQSEDSPEESEEENSKEENESS